MVLVVAPHLAVASASTGFDELYTGERFLKDIWNRVKKATRRIFRPGGTLPGKIPVKIKQWTDITYVALGDSYAAGVGSGGGKSDLRHGDLDACCSRNGNAYPELLAHMLGAKAKLDFRACMGAETLGHANSVESQMKHATRNADLVTVTVGGNDMGFSDVVISCLGGPLKQRRCLRKIRRARAKVWREVSWRTRRLQRDLRRHFPYAVIVFTGYPIPFPWSRPDDPFCKFPAAVRREMNRLTDTLNKVLRMNVDNFVAVSFSGRELCKDNSWIHNTLKPAIRVTHNYDHYLHNYVDYYNHGKPDTCTLRRRIFQHIAGAYHLKPEGQKHYAKKLYAWYQWYQSRK